MKAKIAAIKAVLQAGLPFVKKRDIYVTEDVHLIRSSGGYPAVGIKDGTTIFNIEAGDQEEVVQTITLAAYVQLLKPEAGIMGDGIQKGVLDLAMDIIGSKDFPMLRNNLLGGLADSALPVSIGASELLADDRGLVIQMVPVVMQYTRYDEI